ncbi:Retrovirus-related Pol polyprotein from transposon [Dictyocoela muelleri]|nr:Retrovirus-related Pol polyprotein from transposon [Dictyocoela muelleri]
MANGNHEKSEGELNVKITSKFLVKDFEISLKTLENLQEEIILGQDFLRKSDAIINISKKMFTINKIETLFNSLKTANDWSISENTTKGEKLNSQTALKRIIKNYLESIDDRKPIKIANFKIPTFSDKITSLKLFSVQLFIRELLDTELKTLLDKCIIKRSSSLYASSCFVKKKNDGAGWILIDYRMLNSISHPMQYHFPDIFENFHKFIGSNIYSRIDLRKRFYKVKIEKSDQHKTAFITSSGKYEFTRVPFGLLNAPKFFHNLITEILHGIPNVSVFVDHIIIYTTTVDENLKIIKQVLNKLSDNNTIVNLKKI